MPKRMISNGFIEYIEWTDDHGRLHREDGPAVEFTNGMRYEWYRHGIPHREADEPAFYIVIDDVEHFIYFKNGKCHRPCKPAQISIPGGENWIINDLDINDLDINDDLAAWMIEYDIDPDWRNWRDHEQMLFRLRF